MSNAEGDEACANCGKAAVDNVKLKICTACKLVKYCSVDCQKNHRPQHKKACKKRAAEIRDDRLFTQLDESHWGECPLCCLPLSIDTDLSSQSSCCCKRICDGCEYANMLREREQGLEHRCAFCREPFPDTDEEHKKNYMHRMKANDPKAFCGMGQMCLYEGNDEGAFEYYTKAAELGDVAAHWNLSIYYNEGIVVEKNEKRAVYHWEKAAIGGHPFARYNLGNHEFRNRRIDRAVKHWIIAANQGFDDALDVVRQGFRKGYVSKEEYASTLRGHQAAVDATKSEQRDAAYVLSEQRKKVANRCQIAGGVTKKFTKKGSRKG